MADFGEIYLEYFSDVYRYVLSLCMDETLSEEITQDTFFKAMRSIDKFNGPIKIVEFSMQHSIYGMSTIISSTSFSMDMMISIGINSAVIMLISTVFGLIVFRKYEL